MSDRATALAMFHAYAKWNAYHSADLNRRVAYAKSLSIAERAPFSSYTTLITLAIWGPVPACGWPDRR